MDFQLNDSPYLTMAEITRKLFNCNFLSDVQFLIDDKIIYAHSMELMKRSVVFQNQLLNSLGDNKLIPINDVMYDSVFQFLRFIYCDECDLSDENAVDVFKLACRYRVIALQNIIFEYICSDELRWKIFEYCLLENNQLYTNYFKTILSDNLKIFVESNEFVTLHPIVIEEILKFERLNISEFTLFKGVARWIHQNADDIKIESVQLRNHYANLIGLIRFPVMTSDEIKTCANDFPTLFSDSDLGQLFKAMINPTNKQNLLWNSQKRGEIDYGVTLVDYSMDEKFETTFTVTCEMFLCGLWIGNQINIDNFEITFKQQVCDAKPTEVLTFICPESPNRNSSVINLGSESIRVVPHKQFTIEFKYCGPSILSRTAYRDCHTNISSELISFKTCSNNMIELYFKLCTD